MLQASKIIDDGSGTPDGGPTGSGVGVGGVTTGSGCLSVPDGALVCVMLSSSRISPFGSSTCVLLTKSVVTLAAGCVDKAVKLPRPIWPMSGVSPLYVHTRFGISGLSFGTVRPGLPPTFAVANV